MTHPALVELVNNDPELAKHPQIVWLRENPDEIERVLPAMVRSSGEFVRLQRAYPQASRALRLMASQVGKRVGDYHGRA